MSILDLCPDGTHQTVVDGVCLKDAHRARHNWVKVDEGHAPRVVVGEYRRTAFSQLAAGHAGHHPTFPFVQLRQKDMVALRSRSNEQLLSTWFGNRKRGLSGLCSF